MNIEMMRHRLWITIMVLCGLLAAPQFSSAQDLTPEQEARILQRFPQVDRDGDGNLSSEEIEPLRELIEKAREKRKARTKQAAAKPKGPAQTANDNPQPDEAMKCDLFNTEEILDENTLDIQLLKDWHVDEVTGTTRQKLIEINVAEWWPGQDYRIPVRMIVPLEGKAKGFSITGANPYEPLMKDSQPSDFQAKLLAGGVGIVKTHVKAPRQIPGKKGLEQKMGKMFMEERNPRYTTVWPIFYSWDYDLGRFWT